MHSAVNPAVPTRFLFLWLSTCEHLHAPRVGHAPTAGDSEGSGPHSQSPSLLFEALGIHVNSLSLGFLIC